MAFDGLKAATFLLLAQSEIAGGPDLPGELSLDVPPSTPRGGLDD